MCGGASLILSRYHEADVTRIRGGHMTQVCAGLDGISMYLTSLCGELPVGIPLHYKCVTLQLSEDIDDCEHADQLETDLEIDPYDWIQYEKRPDGQFYSDFERLMELDPHLAESIQKSKTAAPRQSRAEKEETAEVLLDQRRKLTELRVRSNF